MQYSLQLFLCSTVFIQHHSCSPVPTNRKIRNDVRRKSVDQSDEGLVSSTEATKPTTTPDSPRLSSDDSSTVPSTVSTRTPTTASDYDYDTKIVKFVEIFKVTDEEHAKVKRDTAPRNMVDPGRQPFKPESGGGDDLELAETHLFRPLFKYQSVNAQRQHIRRQSSSTTTQRT